MKKNLKNVLLLLMVCLLIVTGCQKTPVSDTEDNAGKNSETEHLQQGKDEGNDYEEVKKQKSAILEQAVCLETESNLYRVPNTRVERDLQQEVALFEENLLLWGSGSNQDGESGFFVSLISLQTGEVLQEKMFSAMDLPNVQVCGDKVAVIDWGTGKVTLLDRQFEVLGKYETNTSYCAIYLNQAATAIYCFTQDGVKVMDTKHEGTDLLLEEAAMLFASGKCGDAVSVTYTDKHTQMNESAIVDLETGKVEMIPFDGAFHYVEYEDGIWLAGVLGEEDTYYLGKSQRPKMFVANEANAMVTLLADPLRIMATAYDDYGRQMISLYSLDGKFLSKMEVSEQIASIIYEPVWSEADGGYFFTAIDAKGKDMLLFWDMSVPSTGEDLMLESVYEQVSEDSTVSKEMLARAKQLGSKYGVDILIGDQTADAYGMYWAAHEMDETYIADGLDALELALAKYPDGFMKQLVYGDQKKLEIHLTGAFTLKEYPEGKVNGFTTYIGFAQEQEGKNVVAVDITMAGSIEQTLHHEIMHIINYKLVFDANLRSDALYSEEDWNALNPKGFTYVEDKFYLPEDIYWDGYESYFIDIYSRTSASEDRARIMEYAMADAGWAFSNADGRHQKLDYLCKCIRDAFDTKGWPKQTYWEQILGNE